MIPTTGKWVLSYGDEAMYISEKRTPIPPIDSWRLANGRPGVPTVRAAHRSGEMEGGYLRHVAIDYSASCTQRIVVVKTCGDRGIHSPTELLYLPARAFSLVQYHCPRMTTTLDTLEVCFSLSLRALCASTADGMVPHHVQLGSSGLGTNRLRSDLAAMVGDARSA